MRSRARARSPSQTAGNRPDTKRTRPSLVEIPSVAVCGSRERATMVRVGRRLAPVRSASAHCPRTAERLSSVAAQMLPSSAARDRANVAGHALAHRHRNDRVFRQAVGRRNGKCRAQMLPSRSSNSASTESAEGPSSRVMRARSRAGGCRVHRESARSPGFSYQLLRLPSRSAQQPCPVRSVQLGIVMVRRGSTQAVCDVARGE